MSVSLKPKSDSMLIRLLPAAVRSTQGWVKICRIFHYNIWLQYVSTEIGVFLYPLDTKNSLRVYIHTQPLHCPACCHELFWKIKEITWGSSEVNCMWCHVKHTKETHTFEWFVVEVKGQVSRKPIAGIIPCTADLSSSASQQIHNQGNLEILKNLYLFSNHWTIILFTASFWTPRKKRDLLTHYCRILWSRASVTSFINVK